MFRILSVVFLSCFAAHLLPDEGKSARKEEKYQLSVCAIFKNEARYLKEWIEYHRLIGVDHFYLYNNGSTDGSMKVLQPYSREGSVTVVEWLRTPFPDSEEKAHIWALSTQVAAYVNAAKWMALGESKWLVFLNIDEFLVPSGSGLKEVLKKYDAEPGIILASDCFNAERESTIVARNLVTESLHLTAPPKETIQIGVEKMIFKPEEFGQFLCAPFRCILNRKGRDLPNLSKREMKVNRYVHRSRGGLSFSKRKDLCLIDNRSLSDAETTELLELDYEIEDQHRAIQRFLPDLQKKMRLER